MLRACSGLGRRVIHRQHTKRITRLVPIRIFSRNTHRSFRAYQGRMNTLNWDDGPLVWIDCEMTGLDPKLNEIIEIAVSFYGKHRSIAYSI